MNSFNPTSKMMLLLLLATLMVGCGASTKPRGYNYSSMTPTDLSSRTITDANAAGAECSFFDSRDIRLSGKVTSYYHNGVLQEDRVRLRFTGIADQFQTNRDVRIQMFRWKGLDGGGYDLDQTPVNFIIHKNSSNSIPISGTMTSLNLEDISRLRQQHYINGTTALDFFNQTTFVVTNVDYSWDALKIVMYNGTQVIGQVDFLLPIFAANPNRYAELHPSLLNQLHPFWSERSSMRSDQEWAQRSKNYCF